MFAHHGYRYLTLSQEHLSDSLGREKAEIMQKVVENSITDTLMHHSFQTHPNAHVVIDLGAAHHLTRIEHPWLVTSCQWSDKLVRSALVWLCQKLGAIPS